MTTQLPLFPLTTALVPGLVLPLHIFEPRYRMMIEELLAKPEDEREFGIVAVRERHMGGSTTASVAGHDNDDLYPVGVSALLRQAERLDDGRYDIVTIGGRRFQIVDVDRSAPLMRAEVEFLPEPEIDSAEPMVVALTERTVRAFDKYRAALGGRLDEERDDDEQLPTEPTVLSYLITAALVIDGRTRQELLASPDTITRLKCCARILGYETAMIAALGAVPAVDLLQSQPSTN
ncbi:MAG: LON peptidase substrate-binding domain-containing protein [Actinomycetota bacterium]|nr:LON peptidase substrate-binding domain-containing protein [Actinomycetota bacterium]